MAYWEIKDMQNTTANSGLLVTIIKNYIFQVT